ncbi:MAG: response regulator [Eubacteriales bacterium]|nr:response regulator [Eubacteriales bacterium]
MTSTKIKILVVDDEKPIRDWLVFVLGKIDEFDLEVFSASNGKEALELAEKIQPNMIFCDIIMPVMGGLEFLEDFRSSDIETPVVLISNYAEFHYAQKAIVLGATEYVLKAELTRDSLQELVKKYQVGGAESREISSDLDADAEEADHNLRPVGQTNGEEEADHNSSPAGQTNEGVIAFVKRYIEANYMKAISLKELSEIAYLTPQYLCQLYKEETGENISHSITYLRMMKGQELLITTDASISDISKQVGYSSPSYFTKLYKRYLGKMPSEERKA